MKFLILNFLFVFAFGNTNAYVNVLPTISISNSLILVEKEIPAGIIIMADEILMRVDTDNSSIIIDNIEVFDQSENLVMQIAGCNAQECLVDISSLGAGTYDVTVTTDNGYTFSGTVTLN